MALGSLWRTNERETNKFFYLKKQWKFLSRKGARVFQVFRTLRIRSLVNPYKHAACKN